MADATVGLHASHMRRFRSDPNQALASSAHELQQAAGTLQSNAARADAVPTYGVTLAHVEEAIDRLAVALDRMANAVSDWCGESDTIVAEPALPPEARALRWHLHAAAASLRTSEAACTATREWARRLPVAAPDPAQSGEDRGGRLTDPWLPTRDARVPPVAATRMDATACSGPSATA
jgi:hypothetical protein